MKFINLSNSQQLIKIPEFSRMPKLEKLNLHGCVSFSKLHSSIGTFSEMKFLRVLNFSESGIRELPSSIGSLIYLETLNLSKCSKFEKFPDIFFVNMRHLKMLRLSHSGIKELPTSIECLEALEILLLDNCSNFEKFPEIQKNMENLSYLALENTAIKELSCWTSHLTRLTELSLRGCKNLRSLPSSICQLKFLRYCHLDGCSNLEIFSKITEDLEHLTYLNLRQLAITELPSSIERLKRLTCLELSNCDKLETLPNNIGNLTCLHALPNSFTNGVSIWPWGFEKDCTSCLDPELMVAYFPQMAISSKYRSNRWNNFKARFYGPYGRGAQVESCGIHLIYNKAQDHSQQSLQLFNVKRSHDDTEDHPHHKRSKHV